VVKSKEMIMNWSLNLVNLFISFKNQNQLLHCIETTVHHATFRHPFYGIVTRLGLAIFFIKFALAFILDWVPPPFPNLPTVDARDPSSERSPPSCLDDLSTRFIQYSISWIVTSNTSWKRMTCLSYFIINFSVRIIAKSPSWHFLPSCHFSLFL